jgi:hypothetical protein
MGLLASLPKAVVIATYTEKPNIPDVTSSEVCRYPIALPSLDINQVLKKVPELSLESLKITNRDDKRMLALLKFRLGFKIRQMDIISILHRRETRIKTELFLIQFRDAVKESGIIIIAIIYYYYHYYYYYYINIFIIIIIIIIIYIIIIIITAPLLLLYYYIIIIIIIRMG